MTSAKTSDTFAALNGSFVRMFDWNREIIEKTLRKTHEESLRFINHRLEQNARMLESLRDSQGVSGLIAAEHDWLSDTTRDYLEETEKLSSLMLELVSANARHAAETGKANTDAIRAAVTRETEKATARAERQAAE